MNWLKMRTRAIKNEAGDPNELAEDEDAMALRPKLGEDLVDQHHLRQSRKPYDYQTIP